MDHSFIFNTTKPLVSPTEIATGSHILDHQLQCCGAHSGQVLHLFGGTRPLQCAVLLGLCKAASDEGHGSVFFDLAGRLSPERIERAGLGSHYNAEMPADPRARFRVLSPRTATCVDEMLHALAEEATPPAVIVLEGLPALLQNQYLSGGGETTKSAIAGAKGVTASAKNVIAGRVLYNLVLKARHLVGGTGSTLWIAHSPLPGTVAPTEWTATVANTLSNYAGHGVELGQATRGESPSLHIQVKMTVWRMGTLMARARAVTLWGNGQFRNE